MALEMGLPFTALMIQQVTQLIDLAAVADRRAQRVMWLIQIGHEKPAGSPKIE